MTLIGILALVLGVFLGGVGLISSYVFEKDPVGYAEGVCPAPPNGVDSRERQACLRSYASRSGLDIAGPQLLGAGLSLVVGLVLLVAGRRRVDVFDAAPPERGPDRRENASGDSRRRLLRR